MKEISLKANPDIVMLQETKVESFGDLYLRDVWGTRNRDFVFLPSVGASSGMVLIWDTRVAKKVDAFSGSLSLSLFILLARTSGGAP